MGQIELVVARFGGCLVLFLVVSDDVMNDGIVWDWV